MRGKATLPMERQDLYECFWRAASKTVDSLPIAANYAGRLTLGFGVEIRALLVAEVNFVPLTTRIGLLEAKVSQQARALEELETKKRARSPRRDAAALKQTDPKEKARAQGNAKKALVCTKWLEGKRKHPCPDGNDHHGDLARISFVVKLKGLQVSQEKMLELAKEKPSR